MKKRFKVGDRVRIAKNPFKPRSSPKFVSEMNCYKGQVVQITGQIDGMLIDERYFRIKEDGGSYSWAKRWFKPLVRKDFIEIQAETATYFDNKRNEVKKVKLSDLIKEVQSKKRGAISTPILPPGTKYYERIGNTELIVVEEEPKIKRLIKEKYNLAFPYVIAVFIFNKGIISSLSVFYRISPLNSLNDSLLHPNFQQLDIDKKSARKGSMNEQIRKYLKFTWVVANIKKVKGIRSIKKWHKKSNKDSLFVFEIPWIPVEYSLSDIIKNLNLNDSIHIENVKDLIKTIS